MLPTTQSVYLRGGRFGPAAMLVFWRHLKTETDCSGFAGLRGAAESDWLASQPDTAAHWAQYEDALNEVAFGTPQNTWQMLVVNF